jgi:hypothetical protein
LSSTPYVLNKIEDSYQGVQQAQIHSFRLPLN